MGKVDKIYLQPSVPIFYSLASTFKFLYFQGVLYHPVQIGAGMEVHSAHLTDEDLLHRFDAVRLASHTKIQLYLEAPAKRPIDSRREAEKEYHYHGRSEF